MNLLSDSSAVACDKLLKQLLEHERLRVALAKAVSAHSEAECHALLERATAVELPEADDSIVKTWAWLKAAGDARKRVAALVSARDCSGDGLSTAIANAIEVGLEFDPVIVEAGTTLKAWKEAIAQLRAACDAQPVRTLPVLDAAVERAIKLQLNEQNTEFIDASKRTFVE
jgi:hypothetical protein